MSVAKIQVNTDMETKEAAEKIYKELGLNMTTAINMFLKKSIQYKGIPFDVCLEVPNDETLAAFKEGEAILADPNRISYKSIDELKAALR